MDIRTTASKAVQEIAIEECPFDLSEATFSVVFPSNELILLGTHEDLYLGLEVLRDNINAFLALLPRNTLSEAKMIGVVSCGWATPLEDSNDIPPSQNPARRRCRIAAVVNTRLHLAAAVQFESDTDEIVIKEL